MTYSLSQLDAIGDVDPVAEADVYLAYGRDLQAEEILKEAMRSNPERLAIRTKLLEVYAKRRDIKGFELLATQLFAALTRGEGEWANGAGARFADRPRQRDVPGRRRPRAADGRRRRGRRAAGREHAAAVRDPGAFAVRLVDRRLGHPATASSAASTSTSTTRKSARPRARRRSTSPNRFRRGRSMPALSTRRR